MDSVEHERQLSADCETLRTVIPGLERIEAQWNEARASMSAPSRGYFTPDEDDRVRQMLLAYRNYRTALYEIIFRCYDYRRLADAGLALRLFLLGYATGLTLYAKSLKLVQAYEREPLIRNKLNEPDAKFELEEGFFEELLRAYSSLGNYRGIIRGAWFWLQHRREIRTLAVPGTDWAWLAAIALKERAVVRRRLTNVLWCRLRYDWRAFLRTTIQPVRRTRYSVRSLIFAAGAHLKTPGQYVPALNANVLTRLRPQLRPGDVLLMREEKKLTAAILPGFWAHAALFVGGQGELTALGLAAHPFIQKHWVVLRPNLSAALVTDAISEAFGHVGKAYDFEFDFNVSTRLVCTELIYRCYQHRGGIEFPLIKRLGRFTLTGDDIATLVISSLSNDPAGQRPGFTLHVMALKMGEREARFIEPDGILLAMRKIQGGWKPSKNPLP